MNTCEFCRGEIPKDERFCNEKCAEQFRREEFISDLDYPSE